MLKMAGGSWTPDLPARVLNRGLELSVFNKYREQAGLPAVSNPSMTKSAAVISQDDAPPAVDSAVALASAASVSAASASVARSAVAAPTSKAVAGSKRRPSRPEGEEEEAAAPKDVAAKQTPKKAERREAERREAQHHRGADSPDEVAPAKRPKGKRKAQLGAAEAEERAEALALLAARPKLKAKADSRPRSPPSDREFADSPDASVPIRDRPCPTLQSEEPVEWGGVFPKMPLRSDPALAGLPHDDRRWWVGWFGCNVDQGYFVVSKVEAADKEELEIDGYKEEPPRHTKAEVHAAYLRHITRDEHSMLPHPCFALHALLEYMGYTRDEIQERARDLKLGFPMDFKR